MNIVKTKSYLRTEKKFLKKNKHLVQSYIRILKDLSKDPFQPKLKTHKLKGHLSEFYSCSITYSDRLIMTIEIVEDEITLIDVGSHDEVYGK